MLKKDITYKDFNDQERTETFYFSLSRAEIAKMELSRQGGLSAYLKNLINAKDGAAIVENMNNIIMQAVGKRSDDGRNFLKSPAISEDFASTGAYDALFMELITDPRAAAEFVRGLVPKDLAEKMPSGDETVLNTIGAAASEQEPPAIDYTGPAVVKQLDELSDAEFANLPDEVLAALVAGDSADARTKAEEYSREELLAMTDQEFERVAGKDPRKMSRPVLQVAAMRKQARR